LANLRLAPFRAEHLVGFIHRDADYEESIRSAVDKERRGPAFTAFCDDRIIGCAGVILTWPGMGIAWAVFSHDIELYPIWVTRMVRHALHDIIRAFKLHRIELVVLADSKRNGAWARALGFNRENGRARSYTSARKDVIRYEWVS